MRRLRYFLLLISLAVLLSGCAGSMEVLKRAGKALKPWRDYRPVPPPQPGLVLPIHVSPAIWIESFLCRGYFRDTREAFVSRPGQRGWLAFAEIPIAHFTINPPPGIYNNSLLVMPITFPLLLDWPDVDYTLIFFYQNFLQHCHTLAAEHKGRWEIPFIKLEVKPFTTTGDPLNDDYQGIYDADIVIELARVEPYEDRQLTFHRIFYLGEVVIRRLGFR